MSDGVFVPVKLRGRVRDYAWVDQQDAARILSYGWVFAGSYAVASSRLSSHVAMPDSREMHRIVLGLRPGEGVVHHINEDSLDNRRSNLTVFPDLISHGCAPHPRRDARCSLYHRDDLPPHERVLRLAEREVAA